MKYYFFILLISVSLLNSCKDPSSLDADREIKTVFDPNNLPAVFEIIPDTIDLGILHPGKQYNFDFKISNISSKKVVISTLNVSNFVFYYTFGALLPINLEEKDKSGHFQIVPFTFYSEIPGNFDDKLNFGEYKNPVTLIKAKVASVWAEDISFNNTIVGNFDLKFLKINNSSDATAKITDFQIMDGDGVIVNEPKISLPLTIEPKSASRDILLTFNPKSVKEYNSFIKITVEYSGNLQQYTDEIISLVGRGSY